MAHSEPTKIAIAVVEQYGQFLVGQRPSGVPLAGLWEFPGGKVGESESPADAAARECVEETGLTVRIGALYPVVQHDYPHGSVELHFFRCTPLAADQLPQSPFRWVAAADLVALEFPAANRALIERLIAEHSPPIVRRL